MRASRPDYGAVFLGRDRISLAGNGPVMAITLWINAQQWGLDRLDRIGSRLGRSPRVAPHLALGLRGEQEALFELRRLGYTVVARRWTSPKMRGDLDLVAWDGEWLCFVEVKTRSQRNAMIPAEVAVDRQKQTMLRRMAQAYLGRFPEAKRRGISIRFDVMAVYLNGRDRRFELFRGAFG